MKLREFQEELRRAKIDAALFLNSEAKTDLSIEYFTGTHIDYGALVVPARKEPFLVIPGFEAARITKIAPVKVITPKKSVSETIRDALKGAKTIGINEQLLSVAEAKRVKTLGKLVPVSEMVNELRMTKTDTELKRLQEAADIGCDIINDCIDTFARFTTEEEVARYLRMKTIDAGCELSFPAIVASGANAAFPHHIPGGKLHRGFVVLDFGVRHKGYCSDMTRTVFLGTPNAAEIETYETLKDAQEWAIGRVKPGINAHTLEQQVTKKLGTFGKYFIHRLGHSVGLQVHDVMTPAMVKKPILRERMLWTIEPGIYMQGKFGMRIEDTVVVTAQGNRVLTKKTSKDLTAIRH